MYSLCFVFIFTEEKLVSIEMPQFHDYLHDLAMKNHIRVYLFYTFFLLLFAVEESNIIYEAI